MSFYQGPREGEEMTFIEEAEGIMWQDQKWKTAEKEEV